MHKTTYFEDVKIICTVLKLQHFEIYQSQVSKQTSKQNDKYI